MDLAVIAVLLTLLEVACADQYGTIRGKVIIPSTMNHSSTVLYLHTSHGEQIQTFVGSDGSFTFQDVPPGVHMLQPIHRFLIFPEIRIEVNRKGALIRASFSHNRHLVLQSPLVIRPAAEAHYFEKRKPFDVWSLIKSPYGLMIIVSVFAIVVFPRMKMDPEDYKELQDQLRAGGQQPESAAGGGQQGQRQQAARLRDR